MVMSLIQTNESQIGKTKRVTLNEEPKEQPQCHSHSFRLPWRCLMLPFRPAPMGFFGSVSCLNLRRILVSHGKEVDTHWCP